MAKTGFDRPLLVTGAAGKTGGALIRALVAQGRGVRALVHRSRHRVRVRRLGAGEVVLGDLTDRGALAEAVAGTAGIYHICPNVHPREVEIGRLVVAAAHAASARRFVFHSVLHPQVEAMPHHWAKLRVEELLFTSGLEITILQPAPYMQNLLGQWESIAERGRYRVPYALEARIAMVDLEEVAEAAARVLGEPGHAGATYELCGPGLLDQRQIAAVLGERLGREVRAEAEPASRWAERAGSSGLGTYQVETLVRMFRYYGRYGMAGGSRALEGLLGRRPSGLAEWLERQRSD